MRLILSDEIVAASPEPTRRARNPFALQVKLTDKGVRREIGLVPDFAFGFELATGERRNFLVEIDRGTMPITRRKFSQTSFERKMRSYLAAHAAKRHERQFGWKTFRVLTVTTDIHRAGSMIEALHQLHVPHSPGAPLFLFAIRAELRASDPFSHLWRDGDDRAVRLI